MRTSGALSTLASRIARSVSWEEPEKSSDIDSKPDADQGWYVPPFYGCQSPTGPVLFSAVVVRTLGRRSRAHAPTRGANPGPTHTHEAPAGDC